MEKGERKKNKNKKRLTPTNVHYQQQQKRGKEKNKTYKSFTFFKLNHLYLIELSGGQVKTVKIRKVHKWKKALEKYMKSMK